MKCSSAHAGAFAVRLQLHPEQELEQSGSASPACAAPDVAESAERVLGSQASVGVSAGGWPAAGTVVLPVTVRHCNPALMLEWTAESGPA